MDLNRSDDIDDGVGSLSSDFNSKGFVLIKDLFQPNSIANAYIKGIGSLLFNILLQPYMQSNR